MSLPKLLYNILIWHRTRDLGPADLARSFPDTIYGNANICSKYCRPLRSFPICSQLFLCVKICCLLFFPLSSCLSGLVGAVFGQISMQEGSSSPSCRHVVPLNLDIAPAAAVRAARRTPDKGARPRYGPRASPCAPLLLLLLAGGKAGCQPGRWSCASPATLLPPSAAPVPPPPFSRQ